MFEDFPRAAPIVVLSIVTATLRVLVAGKRSLKVALLSWFVALMCGLTAGYVADGFEIGEGAVRVIAVCAALMGDHLVVGAMDLAKTFREDPEGTIVRWTNWWRSGGRPNG